MDEYENDKFERALKRRRWDDELFKHTDQKAGMLMLNDKFISVIDAIRQQHKQFVETTKRKFKPANPAYYLNYGPSYFPWDDEVSRVMVRAKLRPGWRRSINNLILLGIFIAPPSMLLRPRPNERGEEELCITINDSISNADFAVISSQIKHWQKQELQGRVSHRNPYANWAYYLEMRELRKIGKSHRDIAKQLCDKYADNDVKARDFDYVSVGKILSNFDKKIDRLFD